MNEPQAVYRKDYQAAEFSITQVHLTFELGEEETLVSAVLNFKRADNSDAPLVLHGEELDLRELQINGTDVDSSSYTVSASTLSVANVPNEFELRSVVSIKPQENTSLSGLYKSSGNFCTQCEAMGFRRITYFLDRPDVMSRYQVKIIGDKSKYPVMLSNGNRIAEEDLDDGRHSVSWEDPFPKPSYLFALVAGTLQAHRGTFTTMTGRNIDLEIWVEEQNIDKCEHALRSLQKSMKWDEEEFGREYDLDLYMIVAVNDFNMGAMENKGLNIFNSKYVLAKPDTATDDDYEGIEGVIAHEYFHNWTGNRVTCRDWFQLTLKEGLTVFRDQQFTADMTSPLVKRIDDVRILRIAQFPEDEGPMSHPIRPESYISMDNFYTSTVYNKGSEIIRMYHTLLSKDGFRKGMDLYFDRHDGQAVTCDDFRAAMADANNFDLNQFGNWYKQRGTPTVSVETSYDGDSQTCTLSLKQSIPALKDGEEDFLPLHIPLALGFIGQDGSDVQFSVNGEQAEGNTHVYSFNQLESELKCSDVPVGAVLSINRGFSAPVTIVYEQSATDMAFLMAHDSDGFNRWQAAQNLARLYLLEAVAAIQDNNEISWPSDYLDAFGKVLKDDDIDGSFKSLMLQLPAERELAQAMDVVDVDAIHAARQSLRSALYDAYKNDIAELYVQLSGGSNSISDQSAIQDRRLKNTLLSYLCSSGTTDELERALKQFSDAKTMTDAEAALSCLVQHPGAQSERAVQVFYDKWNDDPLVMDKWFRVQCMSQRTDCLDVVKALCEHEQFVWTNPNRVRSVLGAFCMGNQLHFHAGDGSGYDFLCDAVSKLQSQNPQLAARLVSGFNQWKRFDKKRQDLQRAALEKIAKIDGLSKDVYEIVHRALEH